MKNAYALMGIGCNCQQLGAVSDFDVIRVGGSSYPVSQILDKTLIASVDTKVYSGTFGTPTLVTTIKAGQPLGKVYSYLRPDQTGDGRSWLQFESSYNKFYFAPNEAASSQGLQEQGALTVDQAVKEEQDAALKENDPVGYYLKKYGKPALIIIGVIVIASGIAKEAVKGSFNKSKTATTS